MRDFIACIPYSEIELSPKFIVTKLFLNHIFYFFVYNIEISFIIVFTPKRNEHKFKIYGCFFEFILLNDYLNIFPFYRSGFYPVS